MEDIGSTLRQMHGWMNDYMKSFYSDDDEVQLGIVLKEKHTGYVTSNARQLAEHLRLEEHDVALAEIVGLFHDVGRFAQYSKYKTFNDAESEDHADLGAQVLEELPLMKNLSNEDFATVRFAIKNHNKRIIEPTADERKLLFAKMIRDADKLDIYRVLEPYLSNPSAGPNSVASSGEEVSPDFIDDFMNGKQVDFYRIRTNGDRKLVRLMWVYDINFAWTMERIVDKGYVERIAKTLSPMNENMKLGIAKLEEHIRKKCAEKD